MGHGCESGWQDFGPERHVTRADGNVLYELDGKPALALYKEYLGVLADQLPGSALLFPLSIRTADDVRTAGGAHDPRRRRRGPVAMTFAGEIPTGAIARLMRTNIDRLAISAETAARQALALDRRARPRRGDPCSPSRSAASAGGS